MSQAITQPLERGPTGGADELAAALDTYAALVARLKQGTPIDEGRPVAVALWRAESARSGMPIAVRCFATWWSVQSVVDPSHDPGAVAAAVAGAVARAAGMRRRRDETSRSYGTNPEAVERVVGDLGDRLRLDRLRGW